jgi:hypothetical protein
LAVFVIAWTCAAAVPLVPVAAEVPEVVPVLRPSELEAGRSEARSEVTVELVSGAPGVVSVPPIAEAISDAGDSAELTAVVAFVPSALVEPVEPVPSADDSALLKLVDPAPVAAPVDVAGGEVPTVAADEEEEALVALVGLLVALLGSAICCCIARIWEMRLVTASILISCGIGGGAGNLSRRRAGPGRAPPPSA